MMQRFNCLMHLQDVGLSFNTQEKGSISVAGGRPFYVLLAILFSIALFFPILSFGALPLCNQQSNPGTQQSTPRTEQTTLGTQQSALSTEQINLGTQQSTLSTEQTKPRVVILATGGTIAGSAESSFQASYNPGVQNIEMIISSVPEINSLANLKGIQVCNISSQNMEEEMWIELWRIADSLFTYNLCDGIVITHGTDTMEETAYFLNLTLRHTKPVIITGSMRPATSLSADGPFNLYNAVALAASPLAHNKGVMVTMNDYIYCANDVTKNNTVNTNAFSCPNFGPLGYMREGIPTFYRENKFIHTAASEFDISKFSKKSKAELSKLLKVELNELPKTEIALSYAFASGAAINAIIDSGAEGIIIAGVGHGNFNREILKGMKRAVAQNIAVVRSSRILIGGVDFAAEEYDPQYPVSLNKSPQKARILLMLALTKTSNPTQIQHYFQEY